MKCPECKEHLWCADWGLFYCRVCGYAKYDGKPLKWHNLICKIKIWWAMKIYVGDG